LRIELIKGTYNCETLEKIKGLEEKEEIEFPVV
jgi:hypothetical protein